MQNQAFSFEVLEQADSTNNYAMGKVHAGMAKHGDAYFTDHQTAGKGQRGKQWFTEKGKNIALSIVLDVKQLSIIYPFELSIAVSLGALDFFGGYVGDETKIKWPNDIYWRDRKAGGVLIENKYNGKDWKWAIVGVGININQVAFNVELVKPVSLTQITGKTFNVTSLAKALHVSILKRCNQLLTNHPALMLAEYNGYLYKINQPVKFKKDNIVFESIVTGVSAQGQLLTKDVIEKQFEFGEIEWIR